MSSQGATDLKFHSKVEDQKTTLKMFFLRMGFMLESPPSPVVNGKVLK